MKKDFLEKIINQLNEKHIIFDLVKNNDIYMELLLFYKSSEIKIVEQTKQFQLYVRKKETDWISMYWVAKYLKIDYEILKTSYLSNNYEDIINYQITYIINWLQNNMKDIDNFFADSKLSEHIEKMRNLAVREG